jgi:hypothetical protein
MSEAIVKAQYRRSAATIAPILHWLRQKLIGSKIDWVEKESCRFGSGDRLRPYSVILE